MMQKYLNEWVIYGGLPCLRGEALADLQKRVGIKGRDAWLMGGNHTMASDDPRNTPEHRALAIKMLNGELD